MERILRWLNCYLFNQHEYELKFHSFGAYDQEVWEECKNCNHQGRTF